jgi:hypothetical protein
MLAAAGNSENLCLYTRVENLRHDAGAGHEVIPFSREGRVGFYVRCFAQREHVSGGGDVVKVLGGVILAGL